MKSKTNTPRKVKERDLFSKESVRLECEAKL